MLPANSSKIAAQKFAENLRPILLKLGPKKPTALVRELIELGVPAPRGGKWHVTSLRRVLKRLEPSLSQEIKAMRRATPIAGEAWARTRFRK